MTAEMTNNVAVKMLKANRYRENSQCGIVMAKKESISSISWRGEMKANGLARIEMTTKQRKRNIYNRQWP